MNSPSFCGFLAGLVVCMPALAGRRTGYQTFGPFTASSATMQDPGEVSFPAYSAGVPLQRVRLTLRHHISYAYSLENLEPVVWWGQWPYGYPSIYSFPWFRTESGGVIQSGVPSWSISLCTVPTLGPYDGIVDYAGSGGTAGVVTWNQCAQPDYWTTTTQIIEGTSALAPFRDPDGTVELAIQPMTWLQKDVPLMVPSEGSLAGGVDWFRWDIIVDRVEYNP